MSALNPPEIERILERGRDLAASIMAQHERFWRAPFNGEEQWRLEKLQASWAAYEKEARAAGVNVEKEFERLDLLRPYQREITASSFARQRLRLLPTPRARFNEAVALAEAAKNPRNVNHDDGMWAGVPRGV